MNSTITPTKTVCYVQGKDGVPHEVVKHYPRYQRYYSDAIETKTPGGCPNMVWFLDDIERITVREELVKFEQGKIRRHPFCNKNFGPLNPCDCGDCLSVLNSFSFMRPIPLPEERLYRMHQGEWPNEE